MSIIPQNCPSCSSPLQVTQLTCTVCGTGVVGAFELSPFMRLSAERLRFLEQFVRYRGNVKEMERATGESYWAIRRKLDEIIEAMGFDVQPDEMDFASARQDILKRLSEGEISVEEAKKLIAKIGEK